MAISDNILKKSDDIQKEIEAHAKDPNAGSPVTDELHSKCMKAILGGGKSSAWEDYMNLFAQDATELARLIPDGTNLDEARAYLVANGKCMMGTTTRLIDNVGTRLD